MSRSRALRAVADAEAHFDTLFRSHHLQVLAYCMRRVDRADAEEVAAEVFTVAWRRLGDVPPGDRALPWLYGIARHTIANQWRANRRRRNLAAKLRGLRATEPAPPDLVVVQRLEDRRLVAALSTLSSADQEVLRLAIWEKLSHRDIGEVLGCSEQAVGQRISRARKKLARVLEQGANTKEVGS